MDQSKRSAVTLSGKWLPTEGTSFDRKHGLATAMMVALKRNGVAIKNMRDYRKTVIVPLREHLRIVERQMCAAAWDDIDFERVPSVALKCYRKAFAKNTTKFADYLARVRTGNASINTGRVFAHQLVEHYMNGGAYDETVELMWREIVKTARAKFTNSAIAIVDVSGSMSGLPMTVAIALGLLLSEIAWGPLAGEVITFHESPSMFHVANGKEPSTATLQAKVQRLREAPWGCNTNLQSAMKLLLDTCLARHAGMPNTLYIFSDMQFDQACQCNSQTNFDAIKSMYAKHNRAVPNIVFWNLRANTVDFPTADVPNVALVSGFSQTLLELFVDGQSMSPHLIMLKALNAPRYDRITL